MDIAFNKLEQEVPIDAVSNQINKTIQSYKDGKDQALIGGMQDIENRNSITQQFYEHIKETPLLNNETGEIEVTRFGDYLIDKEFNCARVSSEAFGALDSGGGSSWTATMKGCEMIFKKYQVPMTVMTRKMCEELLKMLSKTQKLKALDLKINDEEGNTFIKNLLSRNLQDDNDIIEIQTDIHSIKDFMRDTINAFKPFSGDNKYYDRYKSRFRELTVIITAICEFTKRFITQIAETNKTVTDFNTQGYDSIFSKNRSVIKSVADKAYRMFMNTNIIDDDDIWVWRNVGYRLDPNTWTLKDNLEATGLDKEYYGITQKDIIKALRLSPNETDGFEIAALTIKSVRTIKELVEAIKADNKFGSGQIVLEDKKITKNLLSICDDMTKDEFKKQIDSFNEASSDFVRKIIDTTKDCLASTVTSLYEISKLTDRSILYTKSVTQIKNDVDFKLNKLCLNIVMKSNQDLLSAATAMYYSLVSDLIQKLKLYKMACGLFEYIAEGIGE